MRQYSLSRLVLRARPEQRGVHLAQNLDFAQVVAQFSLELLFLRDIGKIPLVVERLSVFSGDAPRRHRHPDRTSAFPLELADQVVDFSPFLQFGYKTGTIFGIKPDLMSSVIDGVYGFFRGGKTEHGSACWVYRKSFPPGRGLEDSFRRLLENLAVLMFGFLRGLFSGLAV